MKKNQAIFFKDQNLEKYIRDRIGINQDPIYPSDVTRVDELILRSGGVKNISGLEYFVNLKTLDLEDNYILDLHPLANLIHLSYLNLNHNCRLSDLYPLEKLKELRVLNLIANSIKDLHPLKDLINIERLRLNNNEIKDISPLKNMFQLEILLLENNEIEDIEVLKALENIKVLNLNYQNFDSLNRRMKIEETI